MLAEEGISEVFHIDGFYLSFPSCVNPEQFLNLPVPMCRLCKILGENIYLKNAIKILLANSLKVLNTVLR